MAAGVTRKGTPLTGVIEFIDNRLEAATGTLRVRARVSNPKIMVSPGMFVRIRLPVGKPKPCLLVPEEALGSDQGQRYVFVLNEKDEVVYRPVKLGPQVERLRVIEEGVKPDDIVRRLIDLIPRDPNEKAETGVAR